MGVLVASKRDGELDRELDRLLACEWSLFVDWILAFFVSVIGVRPEIGARPGIGVRPGIRVRSEATDLQ